MCCARKPLCTLPRRLLQRTSAPRSPPPTSSPVRMCREPPHPSSAATSSMSTIGMDHPCGISLSVMPLDFAALLCTFSFFKDAFDSTQPAAVAGASTAGYLALSLFSVARPSRAFNSKDSFESDRNNCTKDCTNSDSSLLACEFFGGRPEDAIEHARRLRRTSHAARQRMHR